MRKKTLDILRIQQRAGGGGASEFDWWQIGDNVVVAAYQPLGAADLADSYINLANPGTFDAAPGVAPTWAAGTGWQGDATRHLTTGIIPDDGWSALVRFSESDGNENFFGMLTSVDTRFYISHVTDDVIYGQQKFIQVAGANAEGFHAIAGQQGYKDGAPHGDAIGTAAGTYSHEIYLMATNNAGALLGRMHGNLQAVAIYSTTLSSFEVAVMWLRMASLGM